MAITIPAGRISFEIKQPAAKSFPAHGDTIKADTVHHKKHRIVAALLAFPLGVFGLHRMYLGSPGIVPFIYVATVGGGLGVLPFIDFVVILLSKDRDFHAVYTHNKHLFIWQKK